MCVSFEAEYPFPLPVSLALFSVIVIWGVWKVKLSQYSLLTRAMIVFYALPFIYCFPYLWSKDMFYSDIIWGLAANPYQKNLEIIERMTMVGCIGAFGLVAGYLLAKKTKYQRANNVVVVDKSLDLTAFLLIAVITLFLSWLSAPKETILNAAYTTSENRLHGINFNGAYMLSYIFALLLLIDAFNEKLIQIRKLKLKITLLIVSIIVLWLQFMRGDRESVGMIFALTVIYFLNTSSKFNLNKKKFVSIVGFLVIVFFTAQIIGSVRTAWYYMEKKTIPIQDIQISSGTWSAALLTPLSVVGDFYYGQMEPRWGQTYWDYILSLPPGVLTQLMSIERPVESHHAPAWDMRYGQGGTHAMVVPFMNFKSFGVFFVLLLYGFFLGKTEARIQFPYGVKMKLFYSSLFVIAPFWFWYGEMNFIRGIMVFYIVWFSYRLLPGHGDVIKKRNIIC
jgi:hypothetical protein